MPVPLRYYYPSTADGCGSVLYTFTRISMADILNLPTMWCAHSGTGNDPIPEFSRYCKNQRKKVQNGQYASLNCIGRVQKLQDRDAAEGTFSAHAWTSFSADGSSSLWRIEGQARGLIVRLSDTDILSGKVVICDGQCQLNPQLALNAMQAYLLPWQECTLTLRKTETNWFEITGRLELRWNAFQMYCGDMADKDDWKLKAKLGGLLRMEEYQDSFETMVGQLESRLQGCDYTGTLAMQATVKRAFNEDDDGDCLLGARLAGTTPEQTPHELIIRLTRDQVATETVKISQVTSAKTQPFFLEAAIRELGVNVKCDITVVLNRGIFTVCGDIRIVPPCDIIAQQLAASSISCPEVASCLEANPLLLLRTPMQPVDFACLLNNKGACHVKSLIGGEKSKYRRVYALIPSGGVLARRRQTIHQAEVSLPIRELKYGKCKVFVAFGKRVSDSHADNHSIKLCDVEPSETPTTRAILTYWHPNMSDAVSQQFACKFLFTSQQEEAEAYYRLKLTMNVEDQEAASNKVSVPLTFAINEDALNAKKEGMNLEANDAAVKEWSATLLKKKRSKPGKRDARKNWSRGNGHQEREGKDRQGYRPRRASTSTTWEKKRSASGGAHSEDIRANKRFKNSWNENHASNGWRNWNRGGSNASRSEASSSTASTLLTFPPPPTAKPAAAGEEKKFFRTIAMEPLPVQYQELQFSMNPGRAWAKDLRNYLLDVKVDAEVPEATLLNARVANAIIALGGSKGDTCYDWPAVQAALTSIFEGVQAPLPRGFPAPPDTLSLLDVLIVFGQTGSNFHYPFYVKNGSQKQYLDNFTSKETTKIYAVLAQMMMTHPHVEYYTYMEDLLRNKSAFMSSLSWDDFGNSSPLGISEICVSDLRRVGLADRKNPDTAAWACEKLMFTEVLRQAYAPTFLREWCHRQQVPKASLALGCCWTLHLAEKYGQSIEPNIFLKYLAHLGSYSQEYRRFASMLLQEYVQLRRPGYDTERVSNLQTTLQSPFQGLAAEEWPTSDLGEFPSNYRSFMSVRDFSFLAADSEGA